jgi:hypothetical protein
MGDCRGFFYAPVVPAGVSAAMSVAMLLHGQPYSGDVLLRQNARAGLEKHGIFYIIKDRLSQ